MSISVITGDCLDVLRAMPADSVHMVWTSPPYWGLRDYGIEPSIFGGDPACTHTWANELPGDQRRGQRGKTSELAKRSVSDEQVAGRQAPRGQFCSGCGAWLGPHGLEPTLQLYLDNEATIFDEVRRVLRKDGTLWLNIGDCYANDGKWGGETGGKLSYLPDADRKRCGREKRKTGLKPKDRVMLPARVVLRLQDAGWWVRDEIIWAKSNPMPSSTKDRTTIAHEMLYMLSKRAHYYFDGEAIAEPFAESSIARLTQPRIDDQAGGPRMDMFEESGINEANGSRRPNEIVADLATRFRSVAGWDRAEGAHDTVRHTAPRASGNRSHKYVTEYEASETEEHRTKAGLMAIAATAYTTRNKRSVWTIPTEPFTGEFCTACRRYFDGDALAALCVERLRNADGQRQTRRHCLCGKHDAWASHFATAPTELVRPCIQAGTSERGCCSSCGAPWRRQTATRYLNPGARTTNGDRSTDRKHIEGGTAGYDVRLEKLVETTGWSPSCKCDGQVKPCVVLDPFGGSGTTALVADRLGRDVVLIERNPVYAEMARQRCIADAPLVAISVDAGAELVARDEGQHVEA